MYRKHKEMVPQQAIPSQSPGLKLLFNRNIAYLTAEQEYSQIVHAKVRTTSFHQSDPMTLTGGAIFAAFLRIRLLSLLTCSDGLNFLFKKISTSRRLTLVDTSSSPAVNRVSPRFSLVALVASSSLMVCNFLKEQ